jgi:tetratricopeptide (TPR) repeat protein
LADLAARWRCRDLAAVGGVVALFVCALLTWLQTWYWQNTVTLFSHALALNPGNHMAHACLAVDFLVKGDPQTAEYHGAQAVTVAPLSAKYNFVYAQALLNQNKLEGAVYHLRETVRLDPTVTDAHARLASAFLKLKQWDNALAHLKRYIEIRPDDGEGYGSLGVFYYLRGENEKALEAATRALELNPNLPEVQCQRGMVLGRLGRWSEAEVNLNKAVSLRPDKAFNRAEWAHALYQQGHKEAAEREYRVLMAEFPGWVKETKEDAFDLATQANREFRDPLRAMELALQLCEASGFKQPEWLDLLAVAHAAAGNFDQAKETVHRALALATDAALVSRLRERLRLYEQRQTVEAGQGTK